jgi:hypothetical protein
MASEPYLTHAVQGSARGGLVIGSCSRSSSGGVRVCGWVVAHHHAVDAAVDGCWGVPRVLPMLAPVVELPAVSEEGEGRPDNLPEGSWPGTAWSGCYLRSVT